MSRRRVVIGLLAVPLGYLLLVNLILNSGLLPAVISQRPTALTMRWRSAWSPWPGRAYVRGFYMRLQESDKQWELEVDEATTQVELGALLRRTFHTHWVRAKGVEFRMRPRLTEEEITSSELASFPPIEGFSEFRRAENTVEGPHPLDETLWSARLEGVTVAEVREVWLAAFRGTLDAEVAGGRLWLRPGRAVQVGPATLNVRGAQVHHGQTLIGEGLTGRLDCTVDIAALEDAAGARVFQFVDAGVQLEGAVVSMAFLGDHFPFDFQGGGGRLEVKLGVNKGVLLAGSRVEITGQELLAQLGNYRLRGPWSALGEVKEEDGKAKAKAVLALRPFHLANAEGAKLLESAEAKATFTGTEVLLGEAPPEGSVTFALAQTDSFPLRRLNAYIAGGAFKIDSGRATLVGNLTIGAGAAKKGGALTLRATGVRASWGRTQLQGDAVVDVDLARLRVKRESAILSGSSVALSNVRVISSHSRTAGWAGRVDLDSATIKLRPTLRGSAEFSGGFSNGRPFLSLFGDQAGLPKWATPLLQAKGLKVSGALGFEGSTLVMRRLVADAEGLKIRGQLDVKEKELAGLFLVKVGAFQVGLKIDGDKVENQLLEPELWFKKQLVSAEPRP